MSSVLAAERAIRWALEHVDKMGHALTEEVARIAAISSPTFHEQNRANYVRQQFEAAGLAEVTQDGLWNTWGTIRGTSRGRALLLTAHMDTVFAPGVETTPALEGTQLCGPGVRDNSAAVAALLQLARLARQFNWRPPVDVILAATVREEGQGNLEGIRALIETLRARVGGVLVIDGPLGSVTHVCVGSRRLDVRYSCRGGHSWQDYGAASAIHILGRAIHDLSLLALSTSPKTTLNVGLASGGTGINVIAETARMSVDLRSTSPTSLAEVESTVREVIEMRGKEAGGRWQIEVIGDRPAGNLPPDHPFVLNACEVLDLLEIRYKLEQGSTEANIPISLGFPAVAVGASSGRGVHTLQECLDTESLATGLKQILLLTNRLTELPMEASNV